MAKSLSATCAGAIVLSFIAGAAMPARADIIQLTAEVAGQQTTTTQFSYSGIDTFNNQSTGNSQHFSTNFGTSQSSPYQITGSYAGADVLSADQYGGAGGSGNYASTASSYTLNVSALNTATNTAAPINYFGFWLSALDAGNQLSFYRGGINGTLLYTLTPSQILAQFGNCPNSYCGNPNGSHPNAGQPYIFLNFYDTTGSFDTIKFSETPGYGGYESDNHTVGYYTQMEGVPVSEPATASILGVGLLGLAYTMRRRNRRPV